MGRTGGPDKLGHDGAEDSDGSKTGGPDTPAHDEKLRPTASRHQSANNAAVIRSA
jgi:hypothetical protein